MFTLIKESGCLNDALVLYLDVVTGGEISTTGYVDAVDGSRTAISGVSTNGNRSIINFPTSFGAHFAIAVVPSNTYAGLFTLNTTPGLTSVQSAGLSPLITNSSIYIFAIAKSNIGFAVGSVAFKFFET